MIKKDKSKEKINSNINYDNISLENKVIEQSLDSQIEEFAPQFYRLALQYLRTHALPSEEPPTLDELGIAAAPLECEESELFEASDDNS